MNKLTIKKDRNRTSPGKESALEAMAADDFLTGQVANGRFDVDKRIHKSLKNLANATETNEGKSVSMRMLMTEALLDLFAKYEAGEGKYPFDPDEDWNWKGK